MCGQRVDSGNGDESISLYELPFPEYFGLPELEDAPRKLRGKSRKKEQERLLALYGGRCFECGKKLKLEKGLKLDHIVPKSCGGTWLTTNFQPFWAGSQQEGRPSRGSTVCAKNVASRICSAASGSQRSATSHAMAPP
jgi:hypothetical protein